MIQWINEYPYLGFFLMSLVCLTSFSTLGIFAKALGGYYRRCEICGHNNLNCEDDFKKSSESNKTIL